MCILTVLGMISVWIEIHGSNSMGVMSQVAGSHLNKTDLRFFSQLLCNSISPCLPITSAGSRHVFSMCHGKTKMIPVKHIQGQALCWVSPPSALPHQSQGDLNSKLGILWHPATLYIQKQRQGNLSWTLGTSRRTSDASCPPCPGTDQQVQLLPTSAQQGNSL